MKRILYLIVIVGIGVASLEFMRQRGDNESTDASSFGAVESAEQLIANGEGNLPSVAYPRIVAQQQEQIIEHIGYTVSYNPQWNIPNWVAYELTDDETRGELERSNDFLPDPQVKGDPVITYDYSHSGFDRGHMAPAGDMKWSEQAMQESFYMTNVCPQLHSCNAGDWNDLEQWVRRMARKYKSIYVCSGPIVINTDSTIGNERKIIIPDAFYKVLLRKKEDNTWTGIAFVIPNKKVSYPLSNYVSSIDAVEKTTNIDFFYQLPDDIENETEAVYNLSDWPLK